MDDLRARIAAGDLTPGERLPSGRDLARQYGVALMTVQKALSALQDAGLLVSHRGRGTFVTAGAADVPTTTSEYALISRQLSELRELLEQTARHLDDRLTALERAAGLTARTPQSPRRRD